MIPDTFFAGFLVAAFLLGVVHPFATGFFRRLGIHFGITPSAPTLEDGIDRWLNSLSVRTVGRLFARIRIIRSDIERALKFDEMKPPNERFNFLGRVFLEEISERLKVPPPPREDPCQNCAGHGLLPCPACHGDGEQPDVVTPVALQALNVAKVAKETPESRKCLTCGGWGFKGTQPTGRPLNEPQSERRPCPDCNGSGRA